jgi:hypothetical protein
MRSPYSWLLAAVLLGAAQGAPLAALAGELPKLDFWGPEEGGRIVSACNVAVVGSVTPAHRTPVTVQVIQELGENQVAKQFSCLQRVLFTDENGKFSITIEPSGNWNPGPTKVRVFLSSTPQVRKEIEFIVVDDGGPLRDVRPVKEPKSSGW